MTVIELPNLHDNQKYILENKSRFNVVCCGRRFGKDVLLEDIAVRHSLKGEKVAITAPTYKMSKDNLNSLLIKLRPILLKKDADNQLILKTGGTIDFWSLENFESMRGRKYHCHITNEAATFRHLENAWTEVIRATLIDYKGDGWFFSTPKGRNYFKKLFTKGKGTSKFWNSFNFTSYDNPKLDIDELNELTEDMPELVYRQEIMAEFVDGAGTLLKETDILYYDELPDTKLDIITAVDLAISQKDSADYTAIVTLGRDKTTGKIYIIDVLRARMTFVQILEQIKSVYNKFNPNIIGIEQVSFQAAVVQELVRTTNLPIKPIRPDKDKITRFQSILARFEQGLVYLNKSLPDYYKNELLAFPLGKNDDMVDSTAHAFNLFKVGAMSFKF